MTAFRDSIVRQVDQEKEGLEREFLHRKSLEPGLLSIVVTVKHEESSRTLDSIPIWEFAR